MGSDLFIQLSLLTIGFSSATTMSIHLLFFSLFEFNGRQEEGNEPNLLKIYLIKIITMTKRRPANLCLIIGSI